MEKFVSLQRQNESFRLSGKLPRGSKTVSPLLQNSKKAVLRVGFFSTRNAS